MSDDPISRAIQFATQAHARIDQRRKYTGQPYDAHLKAVAKIVSSVTDDVATIAAAWLHDVVEDTPATFQDLERAFGCEISDLVSEVTDVSRPSDGNRTTRAAIDRSHLAKATPRAQTLKLADLVDNIPDICKHDERFGRVFLREAAAILEVLPAGDGRLLKRAARAIEKWASQLDVVLPELTSPVEPWTETPIPLGSHDQKRVWRHFAEVFSARDIAEPIRSFDGSRAANEIAERAHELGFELIGVRRDGAVAGYALLTSVGDGPLERYARPIARDQVIDGDASLTEVIRVLTRHDHGFVTGISEVAGWVARGSVQKPLVRMWLFGMITLIEMTLVERIRARWPNEGWVTQLSRARLESARELQAERRRREQPCELIDCLQLADKAGLLMRHEKERRAFGFETRGAAKRVIQEVQSLRNNLAHSQDIVTHDWPQIARMTANVEAMMAEGRSFAPPSGGAAPE